VVLTKFSKDVSAIQDTLPCIGMCTWWEWTGGSAPFFGGGLRAISGWCNMDCGPGSKASS